MLCRIYDFVREPRAGYGHDRETYFECCLVGDRVDTEREARDYRDGVTCKAGNKFLSLPPAIRRARAAAHHA